MTYIFSASGVARLAQLEGIEKNTYVDSGGYLTIGIGHLLSPAERKSGLITIGEQSVSYVMGLTTKQCMQLCMQDAYKQVVALQDVLGDIPLTQHQFDALVIWTFNIGITAMRRSTLIKKILSGDLQDVPDELRRWNKVRGVVVPGLVNRREAEVRCWLGL
jgi:lysozyme